MNIRKINNGSPFNRLDSVEVPVVESPANPRASVYVPQAIDSLLVSEVEVGEGDDKEKVTFFHSDVHLVLNDKLLDAKLGTNYAEQFVRQMYDRGGIKLPKDASFDDIARGIKSRYIQAPCELKSWIDSLDADMKRMYTEYQESQSTTEQVVEPASTEDASVQS